MIGHTGALLAITSTLFYLITIIVGADTLRRMERIPSLPFKPMTIPSLTSKIIDFPHCHPFRIFDPLIAITVCMDKPFSLDCHPYSRLTDDLTIHGSQDVVSCREH